MNIVVCIKQVPASTHVKMDPVTHTMIRDGAGTTINPYDLHALEAALDLRDRYGGRVTAITMGPPQAESVLKKAIGMTADEGVLVCGREFAGADTLATSYTLSCAVRSVGGEETVDLVICGKLAVDGDTAQVGPGLSEWLGMSLVCNVVGIEGVEEGRITLRRKAAGGVETVRVALPAVLTVEKELNEPRIESIRGRLRAASWSSRVLGAADIGCDPSRIGLKGSPTSVCKVFVPSRETTGNEMIEGANADEKAGRLADVLRTAQIIV